MSHQLHICALGSSFAAGVGIPPIIDKRAMRSGANYAHLLASKLNARLPDLTVSGATLATIYDEPQTVFGHRFEPQIKGVPADTDVITITAGGNDLSYVGAMMKAEIEAGTFGSVMEYIMPDLVPETRLKTADEVAKRFITVLDALHVIAPTARIYLVEYLTLLGRDTKVGTTVSINEEKIKECMEFGEILKQGYKLAGEARSAYCEVVPMADLSAGHGLGSDEP
jgi:lysophospholipase L1-like esterase